MPYIDFDCDGKAKNNIRQFRLENHLTQTRLANLIGVSNGSAVYHWENGVMPSADNQRKLCELFHCTHEELFPLARTGTAPAQGPGQPVSAPVRYTLRMMLVQPSKHFSQAADEAEERLEAWGYDVVRCIMYEIEQRMVDTEWREHLRTCIKTLCDCTALTWPSNVIPSEMQPLTEVAKMLDIPFAPVDGWAPREA